MLQYGIMERFLDCLDVYSKYYAVVAKSSTSFRFVKENLRGFIYSKGANMKANFFTKFLGNIFDLAVILLLFNSRARSMVATSIMCWI